MDIHYGELPKNACMVINYDPDRKAYTVNTNVNFQNTLKISQDEAVVPDFFNYIRRKSIEGLGDYIFDQLGITREDLLKLELTKDISIAQLMVICNDLKQSKRTTEFHSNWSDK